ncbi:MAG: hypothetical protein LW807_07715, partial [Proteobacteria bacterium]|nr:hypothetical protein [Pseudomonadota bacterium]
QLSTGSTLDGSELVPIVQSGVTKKVTTQDIADLGGSGSGVQSVSGTNVDNTDPLNPIVLEQTSLISPDTFTGLNVYDGQASLGSSDGVSGVGNITIDPTTIAQSVTDGVDTSTITIIKDVIEFTSASVTINSVNVATVNDIPSIAGLIKVIAKDIATSSALTGTTAITALRAGLLIPANTFTTGDVCRIFNRSIRSTATGVSTNYIYINTSDTLSGATLIGIQSTASRFYGMERNLYIKSSTVSETVDTSTSVSGDSVAVQPVANSNLNIDWTVNQYIIHAFANAATGNSTVSSGLIVQKM